MGGSAGTTGHECIRCGAPGPFTRQGQPWGLHGACDSCWAWLRLAAWRLYRAARRAGTLDPPAACQVCGRCLQLIGHHYDYRRPFAVRWLCARCHAREHKVTGRCAGCGRTGPPRPLRAHAAECGDWLALPPARQLDPEAEYRRWQAEDREDERGARRVRAIADNDAARAASGARFAASRDLDAELDMEEAR